MMSESDFGGGDAPWSESTSDPSSDGFWTRRMLIVARVRPLLMSVAAVGVPIGVAAAFLPVRGDVTAATLALSLAVVVSLLAALGTRVIAAVAAMSAALSFDFFFTKPYGSLSISSTQDIETTVLLLIGALIVGQLSARNRRNRSLVAQTSEDLGYIQDIAEMMASGAAPDDVVAAVGEELQSLLGLRSCRFETSLPVRPGPTIQRSGDVSWGKLWWGFDTLGLPGKEISLPVEHQQRRLGCYVMIAEAGTRVRRGQLVTAVTLADQAGIALGSTPAAGTIR